LRSEGVDGRDKPGHDGEHAIALQSRPGAARGPARRNPASVTSPRASLRPPRHADAQEGIEAVGVAVAAKATTSDITQNAPAAGSTSRR
jgi:hypothetical protein